MRTLTAIPARLAAAAVLSLSLLAMSRALNTQIDQAIGGEFQVEGTWEWLASLSESWAWLKATCVGMPAGPAR